MLILGEREVPLCLLDTNAVSEMVNHPEGAGRNFLSWAMQSLQHVPCFSPFTLLELRQSPSVFKRFIEMFRVLPCVLLKGYDQLFEEEIETYPDPRGIDPCALAFTPLGGLGNHLENLPALLDSPEIIELERHWNEGRQEILDGMISLVPNYPPDGNSYSRSEILGFIEIAGFSQIGLRHRQFAEAVLAQERAVNMDAFPSLKASLYTVFHKFYVDKNRKGSRSDAFDILISAGAPYVEAIVTERHQADVLRKVGRFDRFIADLQVFTLRDFR